MSGALEQTAGLSVAEKRALVERLLREKAAKDRAASMPVHRLFETQAERTPDAVAVAFGRRCLTFQEVNSQANRLAHRLRALGVGPETLVGHLVERSAGM